MPASEGLRTCPGMCEMVFRMLTGMLPPTMPCGIGDTPLTAVTIIAGDGWPYGCLGCGSCWNDCC